ncbi:MAG: hypothetical protein ABGX20_06775 [Bacillus sp. (in: firmicutes)]
MAKRRKPKYKIGDTVVITIYGTVGRVTDIDFLILIDKIRSDLFIIKER